MSQFGPIASGLFSDDGSNLIIVSAAATPSAGQLLTATSPTASEWDDPSTTLTAGLGIDPVELASNNIQLEVTPRFTFSGNSLELDTVTVPFGGTGLTTLTSNGVLIGDTTNPVDTSKQAPTGDFVGTTDTQTLTNKTMTSLSNVVTGTGLFDNGASTVTFDAAANPTAGQRLTATSPTEAEWQDTQVLTAGLGIDAAQLALDNIQLETTARFGYFGNSLFLVGVTVPFGGTDLAFLTANNVLIGQGVAAVDISKVAPTGDFVGTTDAQVFTNKDLTSDSNVINASGLFSGGSTNTINVRASANPVADDILTATATTTAVWQNQSEVFYAYDTAGGVLLPVAPTVDTMIFNTVYINQNGSNYSYNAGTGVLTINDVGVYEFNCAIGSRGTPGAPVDRSAVLVRMQEDTGGGFTTIDYSLGWQYARQINTGGCRINSMASFIHEVTTSPTDFIVQYTQLENTLYETQGQASRLSVKKIT